MPSLVPDEPLVDIPAPAAVLPLDWDMAPDVWPFPAAEPAWARAALLVKTKAPMIDRDFNMVSSESVLNRKALARLPVLERSTVAPAFTRGPAVAFGVTGPAAMATSATAAAAIIVVVATAT